jgi:hypothetical protein
MSRIRLYFDEDAMQHGLVMALRARHVDILTAWDCLLHQQWIARGQAHCGIILAAQQRFSVGEQMRGLLKLLNRKSASEMHSRLEYLSMWAR